MRSHRFIFKGGIRHGKEEISKTSTMVPVRWTHIVTRDGMVCEEYRLTDELTLTAGGVKLPTYEFTGSRQP